MDEPPARFEPERIAGRPGPLRGYNLFLAICPPPDDAQRIARVAADLRRRHGLRGDCLPERRLHLSLHAVAAFPDTVPLQVIEAAKAAAAGVAWAPFSIVFDRACSFGDPGSVRKRAFVLRCDADSSAAVARLRQTLTPALRRSGLRPEPSSTPHMTLLYDQHVVPEHAIEPIVWTAPGFSLILSHQGLGHHQWLGHWPPA